ncbi:unnamed protein product [Lupinus luteus]|uniref:Uncharacterized protein n=1 Tax=Lupinus luteus TaxID=3873 RepID=A0AAV1XPL3_LUPLU
MDSSINVSIILVKLRNQIGLVIQEIGYYLGALQYYVLYNQYYYLFEVPISMIRKERDNENREKERYLEGRKRKMGRMRSSLSYND